MFYINLVMSVVVFGMIISFIVFAILNLLKGAIEDMTERKCFADKIMHRVIKAFMISSTVLGCILLIILIVNWIVYGQIVRFTI